MDNAVGREDDYFAQVAKDYDRLQPVVVGPAYEQGLDMTVGLVPYDDGDAFEFVELGCGTATLTCRLLDRFPNASGLAVDAEPAMLEVARRKVQSYGQRASVLAGSLLSCQLPVCDVALSSFAFHHVPPDRMPGLLERIARALRPGGCLILLDNQVLGPVWGKQIRAQKGRFYRRHVDAAVAVGRTTHEEIDARWAFKRQMKAEGKDVEYWHGAERLAQLMQEAGFGEAGIVWHMFSATLLLGFVAGEKGVQGDD